MRLPLAAISTLLICVPLVARADGRPTTEPAWNAHAKQFIFAPAFDFGPERADSYRFTATC